MTKGKGDQETEQREGSEQMETTEQMKTELTETTEQRAAGRPSIAHDERSRVSVVLEAVADSVALEPIDPEVDREDTAPPRSGRRSVARDERTCMPGTNDPVDEPVASEPVGPEVGRGNRGRVSAEGSLTARDERSRVRAGAETIADSAALEPVGSAADRGNRGRVSAEGLSTGGDERSRVGAGAGAGAAGDAPGQAESIGPEVGRGNAGRVSAERSSTAPGEPSRVSVVLEAVAKSGQLEPTSPGVGREERARSGAGDAGSKEDEQRRARARLTAVAEPGDLALQGFVQTHGACATIEAIANGRLASTQDDYRGRLDAFDVDGVLEAAERSGMRLICPGDDEWPECLDELENADGVNGRGGTPLALWARGSATLSEFVARSCAIVGSRAASDYGRYVSGEFAVGLAEHGITVVSGAAYGIDGAAHQGALAVAGPTLAVLACGVDIAYPRSHEALLERIVDEGLILSEVPPGSRPNRPRFLVRNRVIAALTHGTVVVEAALRSGALNTAGWATRLGRQVMAVPGPITSDRSAGAHRLIREGQAVVVTSAPEIAEQIAPLGVDLAPIECGESRSRDDLGTIPRRVLEAVPVLRGTGSARIARTAGLRVTEVLGALGHLLSHEFVERAPGGWRLSKRERDARRHTSSAEVVPVG